MKKTREITDEGDLNLATRAVWPSYIGDYSRNEIVNEVAGGTVALREFGT